MQKSSKNINKSNPAINKKEEGKFLNLIKGIYKNPITNTVFYSGKIKISLKFGTKYKCPFSPPLFSIILAILASTVRQEKEMRHIQSENEKLKMLLCKTYDYSCRNPKEPNEKLLQLINKLSKVT